MLCLVGQSTATLVQPTSEPLRDTFFLFACGSHIIHAHIQTRVHAEYTLGAREGSEALTIQCVFEKCFFCCCFCFSLAPLMSPKSSHLDVFNRCAPTMKNSILGSLHKLCGYAIADRLMTRPEQAQILGGDTKFEQASRFLEHYALKIEVEPSVLFNFTSMLRKLGTVDCDKLAHTLGRCIVVFCCVVYRHS